MVNAMSRFLTPPNSFGLGMANFSVKLHLLALPECVGSRHFRLMLRRKYLVFMVHVTRILGWLRLNQFPFGAPFNNQLALIGQQHISLPEPVGQALVQVLSCQAHFLLRRIKFSSFLSGARVNGPFLFSVVNDSPQGERKNFKQFF